MNEPGRYSAKDLLSFAVTALIKKGLTPSMATQVAHTLAESDLMGHTTHGLALLSPYLKSLEQGKMTTSGSPELIRDTGSTITWNGKLLPGAWLVHEAIDVALERVAHHPVVTVVIRKSHHIGCLATYPERATEKGLMMILACSDPAYNRVAPYGGLTGVYSPNPIAAGIPTLGDPIIFDISTSATAGGKISEANKKGERLPHPWLLDNKGKPTDDPSVFFQDPPATILPLGGLDSGYKGFALGILMEALTGALAGFGRADQPSDWMSSVFLQIIDPAAFGGKDTFLRENQYLVDQCKKAKVPAGNPPVRMPGERAFKLREQQRKEGIRLSAPIVEALQQIAMENGLAMPAAL